MTFQTSNDATSTELEAAKTAPNTTRLVIETTWQIGKQQETCGIIPAYGNILSDAKRAARGGLREDFVLGLNVIVWYQCFFKQ